MSVATAVSRVTGFVRTWAMAYALGVTVVAASYGVANNIPNMIYELTAGGILSSLFIPVFLERRQRAGDDAAWRFASDVLNVTVVVLGLVALVGTVWPEPFVRTQTFRISPSEARLATYFFSFFAVQIVFYGVGAVFTGVLNSHRRFLAPAVAPIFNNLVVIATLLGFYVPFRDSDPRLAMTGLAVGTTLGVLAMALVQVPSMLKVGMRYTPRIDLRDPGLVKVVKLMGPTIAYVGVNLVAVSFRNAYAFEVSPSGPASLLYAWMFYQLPYGIFAVALATAIFPELADRAEREDWPGFAATFDRGLRATGLLVFPAAAMLVALATPLITLYRAGRFTAADVPVVAEVLSLWAITLVVYSTFMFVLRSFFSLQDPRTPAITNAITTVLQVALYATLTVGVGRWAGLGLAGVPVAEGIFFLVHSAVLLTILRRRIPGLALRGTFAVLGKVLVASAAGGGIAYALVRLVPVPEGLGAGLLVQVVATAAVGVSAAWGLAALLGVREVREGVTTVTRAVRRRLPGGE